MCDFVLIELPEARYGQIIEDEVGADEGEAFEQGLGCTHAIERVIVSTNERTGQARMFDGDREIFHIERVQDLSWIVYENGGLGKLADTELNGRFPDGSG